MVFSFLLKILTNLYTFTSITWIDKHINKSRDAWTRYINSTENVIKPRFVNYGEICLKPTSASPFCNRFAVDLFFH